MTTARAPRCLAKLVALPAPDPGIPLGMTVPGSARFFALTCVCGGTAFTVRSIFHPHFVLPNHVAFGPIAVFCSACDTAREIFHPSLHGCDAELGHFPPPDDWPKAVESFACPVCASSDFRLTAHFNYPARRVETTVAGLPVRPGASTSSPPPPHPEDLFEYFSLLGDCGSCGRPFTIASIECA